jgi:DNA uptake protein ComE-like DNA-binding protein
MIVTRRTLLVMALGASLGCAFWRHDRPAPPPTERLDLNTASVRRIEKLPGITPSIARRIVDGRPYQEPDDLVERGILTRHELERISDEIAVGHPEPR